MLEGTCKSSKYILPQYSGPAPVNKPCFMPIKVTVTWARTATPSIVPVLACSPDGMSKASNGHVRRLRTSITSRHFPKTSRSSPVPKRASTSTSTGLSSVNACADSPTFSMASNAIRASPFILVTSPTCKTVTS